MISNVIRPLLFKTENQTCIIFDYSYFKGKNKIQRHTAFKRLQSVIHKLFASSIARPPEGVESYIQLRKISKPVGTLKH